MMVAMINGSWFIFMIRSSLISSADTDTLTQTQRYLWRRNGHDHWTLSQYCEEMCPITTRLQVSWIFPKNWQLPHFHSFCDFRVCKLVNLTSRGNTGSFADSRFHEYFPKTGNALAFVLQLPCFARTDTQRHQKLIFNLFAKSIYSGAIKVLSCHNITPSWMDANLTSCSYSGFASLFYIFTTCKKHWRSLSHFSSSNCFSSSEVLTFPQGAALPFHPLYFPKRMSQLGQ